MTTSAERRQAAADKRRLEPTPAEAELERILSGVGGGALAGEFRREWSIGDWVVDFYIPTVRLAIEVDGGYHRNPARRRADLAKRRDLEARGIVVLRLANAEVFGDRERLLSRLRAAWRAAFDNVRRYPQALREPAGALYGPGSSAGAAAGPRRPKRCILRCRSSGAMVRRCAGEPAMSQVNRT
ncbi:MAG: endonuclease domain-containing protein [Burkholderiales bacterium]